MSFLISITYSPIQTHQKHTSSAAASVLSCISSALSGRHGCSLTARIVHVMYFSHLPSMLHGHSLMDLLLAGPAGISLAAFILTFSFIIHLLGYMAVDDVCVLFPGMEISLK